MLVGAAFARRVARERGGAEVACERAGLVAAVVLTLPPVFAVLQGYNVTDPPAIFFSLLTLDLAHRALVARSMPLWILTGLALAAAAQSKFLTLGLLPAMAALLPVLGRDERPTVRQLTACAAAGAVGMLPLLLWNANNGWETIRFNFVDRHDNDVGWRWHYAPEFLLGQIAALSPLLLVVAVVVLARTLRHPRRATLGERVLALGGGVPLLLFAAMCNLRTVGIHWPASAWAPALVLVAARVEVPGAAPAWPGRRAWRWTLGVAAAAFVLLHLATFVPEILLRLDVGGLGRGGQVHTRKVAEVWGWQELADEVQRRHDAQARDNPKGAFVISNQFGVAALLTFYSRSRYEAKLWSIVKDHGESLRRWQDLPSLRGQHALFIVKRGVAEELPVLRERFEHVAPAEELVIRIEGVPVRSFWLVECRNYDGREPYALKR
jgi:4-amino-4-deoxy-L-arabinose transferase-like glycosyltransferase